jgi:hypothetical protein
VRVWGRSGVLVYGDCAAGCAALRMPRRIVEIPLALTIADSSRRNSVNRFNEVAAHCTVAAQIASPKKRRDSRKCGLNRQVRDRAEGGGLLSVPRVYRFNLFYCLQVEASVLRWGLGLPFGRKCSPLCSPDRANLKFILGDVESGNGFLAMALEPSCLDGEAWSGHFCPRSRPCASW